MVRKSHSRTICTGIELPESAIADICRLHGVNELTLLVRPRGEMNPDSDYDLLVDFLPDARPGPPGVSAMTRELTALLGRRVDLAVKAALKPLIRSGVLSEARLIHAAWRPAPERYSRSPRLDRARERPCTRLRPWALNWQRPVSSATIKVDGQSERFRETASLAVGG